MIWIPAIDELAELIQEVERLLAAEKGEGSNYVACVKVLGVLERQHKELIRLRYLRQRTFCDLDSGPDGLASSIQEVERLLELGIGGELASSFVKVLDVLKLQHEELVRVATKESDNRMP